MSDDGDEVHSYLVKANTSETMILRLRRLRKSIFVWLLAFLTAFLVLTVLIAVFWHQKPSSKSVKVNHYLSVCSLTLLLINYVHGLKIILYLYAHRESG